MNPRPPELLDYLLTLWRWKWMIGAGVILAVVVAILTPLGTAPTFSASATYDTGLPGDSDALTALVDGVQRAHPTARVISPAAGVVRITATGQGEQDAAARLDELRRDLEPELSRIVATEQRRIGTAEQRRDELRAYVSELRRVQVDTASKDRSSTGVMLYSAISSDVLRAETQLAGLEQQLQGRVAPSLRKGEVIVARAPGVSPRLRAFVSGVGALVLFTCAAFFLDYVRQAAARRRTPLPPADISSRVG